MNTGTTEEALPTRAGIGLKFAHVTPLLQLLPDLGFIEVHAENYMVDGGLRLAQLESVRAHYPLSIHGVGLSLGGDEPLNEQHLDRLKRLVDRFEPAQFSEHLAWSSHGGAYLNDLLPLSYTYKSLARVVQHVDQLQTLLKRQVLIENPSSYIGFADAELPETEFIRELCSQSGCGLLLDVNNIFVSSVNLKFDPMSYLRDLPLACTGEIHLAGFTEEITSSGTRVLIDTHNTDVSAPVWALYTQALKLTGVKATLLERDADLPPLESLIAQAQLADTFLRDAGKSNGPADSYVPQKGGRRAS